MKKKLLSLLLLVALLIPSTVASAATQPAISSTCGIVIDAATGDVLWSRNADEARVVASMTKVMTTYLTLEAVHEGRISMDTQVPISTYVYYFSRDSRYSNIPFDYNAYYTVEDMIKAFMCHSACAAGPALAELVYGSEEGMVAAMNAKSQELGLGATYIQSYDEGRISARGMATLARHMINEYPEILNYTSQPYITFNGGTYETTNDLLANNRADIGYVDGLKTGWSLMAGGCMTATATKDGTRLISVAMNASTVNGRFSDSAELLRYGFATVAEQKANGYAYATAHDASVTMEGEQLSLHAYLVNGNNYVRLRDFAAILNGTGSQFSLVYDSALNAVVINKGSAYDGGSGGAVVSSSGTVFTQLRQPALYVDGQQYAIDAYLISDLNYMKIRDLCAAIGCGIDWDAATNQVVLIPQTTVASDEAATEAGNTQPLETAA